MTLCGLLPSDHRLLLCHHATPRCRHWQHPAADNIHFYLARSCYHSFALEGAGFSSSFSFWFCRFCLSVLFCFLLFFFRITSIFSLSLLWVPFLYPSLSVCLSFFSSLASSAGLSLHNLYSHSTSLAIWNSAYLWHCLSTAWSLIMRWCHVVSLQLKIHWHHYNLFGIGIILQ